MRFCLDALQYLPDQATKFVGNYSDGLIVSQTRHIAAIENFEDASFVFGRRIGSLIQNPPHMTVALRRPAAVVHFRALFIARACAYPRGEMLLGRKGRCGGTHFGNDLLRRSLTPGHAMKASHREQAFGAVLGKALQPLNGGKALIPILVALQ